MDFASLLKSQISSTASEGGEGEGQKKYFKRSEIEAQREAKYRREQEDLEKARLERVEKKRKRDDEEAERKRTRDEKKRRLAEESKQLEDEARKAEERERRKRLGLPELPTAESEVEGGDMALQDGEEIYDEDELLEKLRKLSEPRRLFGETHLQRMRRYKKLTAKSLAPAMSKGPIPTTLTLVPEAEMKVSAALPKEPQARQFLLQQIASYFDMVLSEWQLALSRRTKDVQITFAGKQAYNNFLAARENLVPLFRRLEVTYELSPTLNSTVKTANSSNSSNILPDTLLSPMLEIVHLAQLKRYVHANDAYLRLSIGKAAWPIGVTMVGIHERSAREKLHETDNQAHIMSDETTRKMLQGIKRCLSFAQTRWPPEDAGQIMG